MPRRDKKTTIRIEGDQLQICGGRPDVVISRGDVDRIEMYKIDQLTIDLICCDLSVGASASCDAQVYTLHEDLPGWEDAIRWFNGLPAFDAKWWDKVARPAFAESRTTVFLRTN